ncbi:hypothetical protein SETIT_5G467100v2 [Setaria italica]|uniref:Uncharacterized protein n=1 Tax=Setaria italica TaxID=4555 RepID=A0A368RGG3_SETIT|nr:hypothetical protein SETIT_5G467100v2 [Setaria italica]
MDRDQSAYFAEYKYKASSSNMPTIITVLLPSLSEARLFSLCSPEQSNGKVHSSSYYPTLSSYYSSVNKRTSNT